MLEDALKTDSRLKRPKRSCRLPDASIKLLMESCKQDDTSAACQLTTEQALPS